LSTQRTSNNAQIQPKLIKKCQKFVTLFVPITSGNPFKLHNLEIQDADGELPLKGQVQRSRARDEAVCQLLFPVKRRVDRIEIMVRFILRHKFLGKPEGRGVES
jgi:hypothetical protein